jgi:hypothetical protein
MKSNRRLFEKTFVDTVDVREFGEVAKDAAVPGMMGGADTEALVGSAANTAWGSRHELQGDVNRSDFGFAFLRVGDAELVVERSLAVGRSVKALSVQHREIKGDFLGRRYGGAVPVFRPTAKE